MEDLPQVGGEQPTRDRGEGQSDAHLKNTGRLPKSRRSDEILRRNLVNLDILLETGRYLIPTGIWHMYGRPALGNKTKG